MKKDMPLGIKEPRANTKYIKGLEMNSYLDARYDLICNIIQAFFEYYDKAMTPDNDTLNDFVCEHSKEIDDIIKDFETIRIKDEI